MSIIVCVVITFAVFTMGFYSGSSLTGYFSFNFAKKAPVATSIPTCNNLGGIICSSGSTCVNGSFSTITRDSNCCVPLSGKRAACALSSSSSSSGSSSRANTVNQEPRNHCTATTELITYNSSVNDDAERTGDLICYERSNDGSFNTKKESCVYSIMTELYEPSMSGSRMLNFTKTNAFPIPIDCEEALNDITAIEGSSRGLNYVNAGFSIVCCDFSN